MSSAPIARPAAASVATLVLALAGLAPASAADDVATATSTARAPNRLELEPHAAAGTAPPGIGQGSGLGVGVRAGVTILRSGLIPNVEDSLAIGVGLDYARYYGKWALNGYQDTCLAYDTAPGGTPVCTEVTFKGGTYAYLYVPIVLQWNFWLGRRASVFAEPGASLYHLDDHGWGLVPAGAVGARWRLADRVALTARVGYPAATIGLSFML